MKALLGLNILVAAGLCGTLVLLCLMIPVPSSLPVLLPSSLQLFPLELFLATSFFALKIVVAPLLSAFGSRDFDLPGCGSLLTLSFAFVGGGLGFLGPRCWALEIFSLFVFISDILVSFLQAGEKCEVLCPCGGSEWDGRREDKSTTGSGDRATFPLSVD